MHGPLNVKLFKVWGSQGSEHNCSFLVRDTVYIGTHIPMLAGITRSVVQLAMGWMVWGSDADDGKIFRARPDWPSDPTGPLHNGYRVIPCGKAAVAWWWPSTPHIAPQLKKE
jgi:hypothetical protein